MEGGSENLALPSFTKSAPQLPVLTSERKAVEDVILRALQFAGLVPTRQAAGELRQRIKPSRSKKAGFVRRPAVANPESSQRWLALTTAEPARGWRMGGPKEHHRHLRVHQLTLAQRNVHNTRL